MEDIFVLVFSNYIDQDIGEIILKIIVQLRMKEYTFFTGVSLNLPGLEKLSQTYLQARQTVDLSEKMDWKNMLVRYNELGVYQLLLAISDNEAKRNYYDNILGTLEQYDKNNRADYLDFLSTYLDCNCNIVVYKIKKISELLDCDLSEMEVRVELYLANMLRNIL